MLSICGCMTPRDSASKIDVNPKINYSLTDFLIDILLIEKFKKKTRIIDNQYPNAGALALAMSITIEPNTRLKSMIYFWTKHKSEERKKSNNTQTTPFITITCVILVSLSHNGNDFWLKIKANKWTNEYTNEYVVLVVYCFGVDSSFGLLSNRVVLMKWAKM